MNPKFDLYPKRANKTVLMAGATILILTLFLAYITNPKPFNHLFDVVFKENLTTKEIVK